MRSATTNFKVGLIMSVNRVNHHNGRIRVMCPKCGIGGGQYVNGYHPKCYICDDGTLMHPASNDKVECTWDEFQQYLLVQK